MTSLAIRTWTWAVAGHYFRRFARFFLKQVAAASWVSQIRRSVSADLPSGSRVDLGDFCENQVGLGEVALAF